MQFIDKEDDLAIGILNLIQNGFQTFLKLTTIFCTGDQCTHIQGKQLLVLQSFRYIPADNSLCQTLYGCRFADTRLTDQYRVILGLTG